MRRNRNLGQQPPRVSVGAVALVVLALLIGLLVGRAGRSEGPVERGANPSGPSRVSHGVPLGYSRDEHGAASAAANHSAALAQAAAAGPERVTEVAELLGTSHYAAKVAAAYGQRRTLNSDAVAFFRAVPLTYAVLSHNRDAAEIRVWSMSILAGEDQDPGVAAFKTATIAVRWDGTDWRLEDVRDTATGPTPATTATTSGTAFVADLAGTEAFRAQP